VNEAVNVGRLSGHFIASEGAPYTPPSPVPSRPAHIPSSPPAACLAAAIYTRFSAQTSGGWPGQPTQPLDSLAGGGGGSAGVLGAAERVAGAVTETVRSGLQKMGL
jgi:hypothetical protein